MADELRVAKEERARLQLGAGAVRVQVRVGDGNPGAILLFLEEAELARGPEIRDLNLGAGQTLRGQVLRAEATVRHEREGARHCSLWIEVEQEGRVHDFHVALDTELGSLASLALSLRFF